MADRNEEHEMGHEPEPEGMPCLSGGIGGTDHDAQRTYVSHAEGCPNATYPYEKCGRPRTKAEGGTTFTVCDECWAISATDADALRAEIEALKGVYADNVKLKAEIEALKYERDEWRDQAGLHQIASAAHKHRADSLESKLAEMREWTGARYRVNTMRRQGHEMVLYISGDWAQKCPACSLRAEVARLEGLITTVRCREGYAKSCQCPDVELHAEARAIRAGQK